MPLIHIKKLNKIIKCESGANLMQAVLEQLPVASSCNGDGICAKCRMTVVSGSENLSPSNPTETFLSEKFKLKNKERVSCQTQVFGDIEVETTYW